MPESNFAEAPPRLPSQCPRKSRTAGAFTLVELLVVIGIIAVLVGMLLPVLGRTRESANSVKCRSNLSQIGAALRMYSNDNRDHFPSPSACGDADYAELAWAFRRGINEPDPSNPATVETLGLHNLLHRLGYAKSVELWVCPSTGGRNTLISQLNSYCWNVSKTTSSYTSLRRARPPVVNGVQSLKDWWYVQDNVFYAARATNTPSTSLNSLGAQLVTAWYMPHQYRVKKTIATTNQDRRGSTNVLFLDGGVGYFIYTPTSGLNPLEALRGE